MLRDGRDGLDNPKQGVAEKVEAQSSGTVVSKLAQRLTWAAVLGKLDRIDPSCHH